MSYKKNKYQVVRNAIPLSVADFVHDYFVNKKQVQKILEDTGYISQFNSDWGKQSDDQCPNQYCHYGDLVMDTILDILTPKLSKLTKLDLSPTYSYARIYNRGAILHKHSDRYSCEVSTTLNLGGSEVWPIWLTDTKGKDIEIKLEPSDMLIYSGCELEHWRDEFRGDSCVQVFLHYNDKSHKEWEDNKYDGRLSLGLPTSFKHIKIMTK